MDKYEYNLKLEEIDKLVDQGDFEEAAKLADTIDWRRVRNVRTLCLISEIYEASGRLEDSKRLLIRAYRKSPVGKNILYRLVEVTTALQQYDEAIEFYSEYVQAAPHDNNRYILKYMIYQGRGSSTEELILILEEYLGQEYTERWAYELAKLYQQAGQMQKCFAACDDLVLWFHSGKYVKKALELKKKYTALTPKQQQIYEDCLLEEEHEAELQPEEEETVLQMPEEIDEVVLAETIMAETEKAIAEEVAARKAELERAEQNTQEMKVKEPTKDMSMKAKAEEAAEEPKEEIPEKDPVDLKVELAKNMREIISGVVRRNMENEDDIPASVDADIQAIQRLEIPEAADPEPSRLSIDDILLSMGEKGKKAAAEALRVQRKAKAAEEAEAREKTEREAAKQAAAQAAADADLKDAEAKFRERARSMTAAVAEDLTDAQKEALQYTNHPEKLLRNKRALPTYSEETSAEDLGATRRIATKEELAEASRQEILAEKTIRIPVEEIAAGKAVQEEGSEMTETKESENISEMTETAEYEDVPEMTETEVYEDIPEMAEEEAYEDIPEMTETEVYEDIPEMAEEEAYEDDSETDEAEEEEASEVDETEEYEEEYEEDYEYLTIPQHLRGLFTGFTEIDGLEDQIANAIIQAEAKGEDRTSRTGNILIFGAHGSGKTTLAMNIAKAVAQDKGSQVMKMAKIYAADLNRKDIAATVARIAGGTLIIEEAGDLEPNTVEQLTTAMEFRTDGLIVILEDEQQYIHELLMRHPRFTMKFTAQIYIPVYTAEELAMFGQIYANAQDYIISEDGLNALYDRISETAAQGNQVAISDVIDMVANAIQRSNKFLRKMTMGKKRYDENDYILLFAKDFK